MRNKILFVLLLVIVFTLGILSVRAYDKYKVDVLVKQQAAQIEQKAKDEYNKQQETLRQQAEAKAKAKLQESCQAGLKAYNALTPAQQAKTTKPVCDLQQVQ